MKRIGIAFLASLALGGCSLAPLIAPSAIEYNQVEENVNNQILVTNVLRARDNAPLYLAEFQNIHVTYTGTLGTAVTSPFGRGKPLPTKIYSALTSASLQSAPSFDATQLDTQQFTQGMLKPIDPVTWEYYWHRNYSTEILLHLFLVSLNEGTNAYDNNPCTPQSSQADCADYAKFAKRVDDLFTQGVYLNIFTVLSPAAIDKDGKPYSTTTKTVMVGDKFLSFEQSEPKISICTRQLETEDPAMALAVWKRLGNYQKDPCPADGSLLLNPDEMKQFSCTHRQVVQCRRSWAEMQESTVEGDGYVLRSVDGVIRYLGRVQQLVDEAPGPDSDKKGVTWTENGVRQTLFQLHHEPGLDRIGVNYRGQRYYVRQGDPSDHTLEVLALLNQLINANKNANEIPSTKAVQIVP